MYYSLFLVLIDSHFIYESSFSTSVACSEPCQTSKKEYFVKIVNGFLQPYIFPRVLKTPLHFLLQFTFRFYYKQ